MTTRHYALSTRHDEMRRGRGDTATRGDGEKSRRQRAGGRAGRRGDAAIKSLNWKYCLKINTNAK